MLMRAGGRDIRYAGLEKEEVQEVKVGLANAKERSVTVEVAAVLSEVGGISH